MMMMMYGTDIIITTFRFTQFTIDGREHR